MGRSDGIALRLQQSSQQPACGRFWGMLYDLGSNEMTIHPIPRKEDLDNLVASLEVNVVALTECLVGLGSRLSFPAVDRAAIHYALKGHGRLAIVGIAPVPVRPHTL